MNVVEQYMFRFCDRRVPSCTYFLFKDNSAVILDSNAKSVSLNSFDESNVVAVRYFDWGSLVKCGFFDSLAIDSEEAYQKLSSPDAIVISSTEIKVDMSLEEYYSREIEESLSLETLKEAIAQAEIEELPSGELGSLVYLGSMTSLFYRDHRPLELSDWYKHHILVFVNALNSYAHYLGGTLVSPDNFQEDLFIQVVQGETPSLG